jgi:glycosyltransferase involved in cell wall biosynthesis
VLLTFLRWVRAETDAEVELVLWRGGPLVDELREVADVTVLHPGPGRRSLTETVELGLGEVGLGRVGRAATAARVRYRLRGQSPPDVLWLNGAGSALVLPHLGTTAPAVAHVHELERGLRLCLGDDREPFFDRADRVVAVSQPVVDLLVGEGDVPADRIVVVPGCVPPRPAREPAPAAGGPPVVGAVGAGSWRKGIDLFLQVAAAVRRRRGDVRFAWVGALDDEATVRSDVRGLGLDDVLELPGEVEDPRPWYDRMAVFCSTAREDPFPLSALEAGAAGVPVIAFANGGIVDLLADGRGTVVGYAAVEAMAERVVEVLERGDGGAGARLADHVRAHHTPEAMAPQLWAQVEAVARRA